MEAGLHELEEAEQRQRAQEARELEREYQTVMDSLLAKGDVIKAAEYSAVHTEQIRELLDGVSPRHMSYVHQGLDENNQLVDGELDDCGDITTYSWIDDDDRVDGPKYFTDEDYYLMSQDQLDGRSTRMENGEPEGKLTNWTRVRHDDEAGEQDVLNYNVVQFNENTLALDKRITEHGEVGDFDNLRRRKDSMSLATYYRGGEFHENVRILVNRNGSPLFVNKDYEPEQVYESFEVPYMVQTDELRQEEGVKYFNKLHNHPNVIELIRDENGLVFDNNGKPLVKSREKARVRVRKVTCKLMNYLWLKSEELQDGVDRAYMRCAVKLNKVNTFTRTQYVKKTVMLRNSDGNAILDDKNRPMVQKKEVRSLISGGLPFKGSYQLCPNKGKEYSGNGKYTIGGAGAMTLFKRFKRMANLGHLETCRKVEKRGNSTIKTRQVYAVLPIRIKQSNQRVERYVVVFADLRS